MTLRPIALAALASALAAPALAAGLEPVAATPVVTPVPAATPASVLMADGDWTGGFVGAQLSYGGFGDADGSESGALVGLNSGYDRDFGRFVLGGEVQVEFGGVDAVFDDGLTTEVDRVYRAGVRLGYDGGRFMPYLTGGYVQAEGTDSVDGLEGDVEFTGGYYGIGVDYLVSDRITVGAQVLRSNFDDAESDLFGDEEGVDVDLGTVSVRATYNF